MEFRGRGKLETLIIATQIKKYIPMYFHHEETGGFCFRASLTSKHHRCLAKAEVVLEMKVNHASHRWLSGDQILSMSVWSHFHLITRWITHLLYRLHLGHQVALISLRFYFVYRRKHVPLLKLYSLLVSHERWLNWLSLPFVRGHELLISLVP